MPEKPSHVRIKKDRDIRGKSVSVQCGKGYGMDGFTLRLIAMLTMLLDHIGWNFLRTPMHLTWIGRIAFPLYAFLLAEGFLIIHNDRSRLVKHLTVMLILAVVSEPGYDLMDSGLDLADYLSSQSNIITLLLGYLGMLATEALVPSDTPDTDRIPHIRIASLICAYILTGFANFMLKGNFNIVGPWLVIAFYWYIRISKRDARNGQRWPWRRRIFVLLLIFACYLPIYFWDRSGFGNAARWWEEVVNYAPWVAGHAIAALIISFYNGELGFHEKWFSKLYTSFYPVHLYIIGVLEILLK